MSSSNPCASFGQDASKKANNETNSSPIPDVPEVFLQENFNLSNLETFNDVLTSMCKVDIKDDDNSNPADDFAFSVQRRHRPPQKLTKDQLRQLQQGFTDYLGMIEEKLSSRISQRSGDFSQVMSSVHSKLDELSLAIKSVTILRRKCSVLNESLILPIIKKVRLSKTRNNCQNVLNKLLEIAQLCKIKPRIQLLLSASDFVGALDLIAKSRISLHKNFERVECLKRLESQLVEAEQMAGTMIQREFECRIKENNFDKLLATEFNNLSKLNYSNDLLNTIRAQASNFFDAYHKSSLEEQKMFLENETWEMVPVRSDFKLVQLKEFHFLRKTNTLAHDKAVKLMSMHQFVSPYLKNDINSTNEDLFGSDSDDPFYEEPPIKLDRISLSSASDDDEDFDLELNKDFVDEDEFITSDEEEPNPYRSSKSDPIIQSNPLNHINQQPLKSTNRFSLTKNPGPVLTNSSLNILRLFGRYIQIMIVLEPISYKILMRIYNLLDYYTMIVYRKFGPDKDNKVDDNNLSPKLESVVRSIRACLLDSGRPNVNDTSISSTADKAANISVQHRPNISDIIMEDFIQVNQPERIDQKKAVALESLIFLVNQLWNLQEYLESLIPADMRPQLREQFCQTHSTVPSFLKARAEIDLNSPYKCNKNSS